jgi:hypothetical protein
VVRCDLRMMLKCDIAVVRRWCFAMSVVYLVMAGHSDGTGRGRISQVPRVWPVVLVVCFAAVPSRRLVERAASSQRACIL